MRKYFFKHISNVSTTISTVSLDLATARADTVASLLTQTYILMSLNPVVSLFFVHEGWGWLLNTAASIYQVAKYKVAKS